MNDDGRTATPQPRVKDLECGVRMAKQMVNLAIRVEGVGMIDAAVVKLRGTLPPGARISRSSFASDAALRAARAVLGEDDPHDD